MKRLRLASLMLLLCVGLTVALLTTLTASAPQSTKPASSTVNTLTAAEKAAGWRLLFDGKTTAGWRAFKKTVTLDEFADFELTFDWKISPAGNSGVFGRVTEDSTSVWHSATEYQILDNKGHADGKKPETSAASAYALYAPTKDMTKTPGEWNLGKIVMKGTHVQHWLNGVKVVEIDTASPGFAALVEKSKFKPYPQFAKPARGHIALQDHGDKVSYRNIKIRPL